VNVDVDHEESDVAKVFLYKLADGASPGGLLAELS
jgi:hypothetical protein